MSNKFKESEIITVDEDEFNSVLKRVHKFLLSRVEKAHAKKELNPCDKTEKKHVEAIKDVYVLVHMMELVEIMAEEIGSLREELDMHSRIVYEEDEDALPEMFASTKTKFLN